jgi:hypothetical protein
MLKDDGTAARIVSLGLAFFFEEGGTLLPAAAACGLAWVASVSKFSS